MQAKTARLLDRYMDAGYDLFHNRHQGRLAHKILLALGMAGLTGLAAQVRIPLPWSPVPITGQTFAVLLAGVLLGTLLRRGQHGPLRRDGGPWGCPGLRAGAAALVSWRDPPGDTSPASSWLPSSWAR